MPGDPSSAAFHVAAAVLVPGSRLVVEGMAANWTRVGFFRILERMGAVVIGDLEERATAADEPSRCASSTSRTARCRRRA